jgi:hypothetical protein
VVWKKKKPANWRAIERSDGMAEQAWDGPLHTFDPWSIRVDGVAIRLADGKDWIVPPLRIDQLLVHLPMLEELAGMNQATPWAGVGKERLNALLAMILDAMQRNYPNLTLGGLQNVLDLNTISQVIAAVLRSVPLAPTVPQTEGKTDG